MTTPTDARKDELEALAIRCEAATGPSDDLDRAIVHLAYDHRIPLACYGNEPINYDPDLWAERHGFEPTRSIDAALSLVPEGWSKHIDDADDGEALVELWNPSKHARSDDSLYARAMTWPLAICAAALKARTMEGM